jgi:hypothetical protein
MSRMVKEWGTHRTQVLRTDYNKSLAATIELSLTSPTFRELRPDARDLFSVVAFFPQGIDENNLDWLFPTVSYRKRIFDEFCTLSLTHRSNGFITMLAPVHEYLGPKDPKSSPLLCATKEHYFTRLSSRVDPGSPDFEEARWIASEDVNVEHLLDVFTSIDANSPIVWDTCADFMRHPIWHKVRLIGLKPKVEELPDNHRSKPKCCSATGLYKSKAFCLPHHVRHIYVFCRPPVAFGGFALQCYNISEKPFILTASRR